MRLVLDANVLIAALIARGACYDLLEHCALHHTLITAQPILDDVRGHLVEKFKYTNKEGIEAVELFGTQMISVAPREVERPICRDPDDDLVLGTAVAGGADYIVTGDKDLLVLREFSGVKTISPRDFLEIETSAD